MASGVFFDPLALVRVAPLVTSSLSLMYANDQHLFLNNFLRLPAAHKDAVDEMVGPYFMNFLNPGLGFVFGTYGSSVAGGLANLLGASAVPARSASYPWYMAGAAFAAAHFAFVPAVMWKIEAMQNDKTKGASRKNLRAWLDVHLLRSFAVDLPAWSCFLMAVLTSMQPL